MKIEVNENGCLKFKEVYLGVEFESNDGERFSICMRDSGFEFNYMGTMYEAKNGILKKLELNNHSSTNEEYGNVPEVK